MAHTICGSVKILAVAAALGLRVEGRKARCFNGAAHRSGMDAKPALVFQTEVNRFKCYACGVRGDAIDLVRGVLSLSFGDAVAWLSNLAGRLPTTKVSAPSGRTVHTPTAQSKEIYARLFELSHYLVPQWDAGPYLRNRGIDLDVANRCNVTELLDPSEVWATLKAEFGEADLRAAGLISRAGRFLFGRHRLLFFYFHDGWPQFVQGRDISGESSCKESTLAGLHSSVPYLADVLEAAPDRVFVCEGCIDTLSAIQLGHVAVGVPGVTSFQDEWFPLFRDVGRVTILFDNDSAGRRQAIELRARFRTRGIRAEAWFPAQGNDLNDLLQALSQRSQP
jgi:DNA primase